MRLIILGLTSVWVGCAVAPEPRVPQPPASAVFVVGALSGLGLFADEQAQAQAVVAAALKERGVLVANPEAISRAWAMAAEGKDPLSGVACGMPLNSREALERWGSALGLGGWITPDVTCRHGDACRLMLAGMSIEGHRVDRLALEAPVETRTAALPALDAALKQLVPQGPRGELRNAGAEPLFRKVDELEVRLTPADRREKLGIDQSVFRSLAPESFLGCFDEHLALLAETSASGEVVRCEAQSLTQTAAAACACQQLKAVRWGAGRWEVALGLKRKDETSDDGRLMMRGAWLKSTELIGDNSIKDWSPGSARLATSCFAKQLKSPARISSKWAVWFDEMGQATKAVEQKGTVPLQAEVASCVEEALKKAKAPCPSRKGLWAMVELQLKAVSSY